MKSGNLPILKTAFLSQFSSLSSAFKKSALFALFLIGLLSCNQPDSAKNGKEAATENDKIELTDGAGRKVLVLKKPKRIMALAPSMTEMLYAVCDTATIVGRTNNCNFPKSVKSKPVVNTWPLDVEKVLQLKPDLIFTAAGITSFESADQLQKMGIPVFYQDYKKVTDIFDGLTEIGKIMHREKQAEKLVDSLKKELETLQNQNPVKGNPTVLAITWTDPIQVYGQNTLFTDKLKLIGARNAVTEVFAQESPALSREYILKLNPDVILGVSITDLDKTLFDRYPELKKVKAYQNKKVFYATDDLMSRPSPRVIESIKELKTFLQ